MKNKHYGYEVDLESRCVDSEHSPEEYGDWCESYENSIGQYARKTDKYPDVASIHDIEKGLNAFVVWIVWSSGDSFGHAYGAHSEVIGLFKDMESALSLKESIEKWRPNEKTKKWEEQYSYFFNTPDGQIFESGFAPWAGYFESLDSVNVDTVVIQ